MKPLVVCPLILMLVLGDSAVAQKPESSLGLPVAPVVTAGSKEPHALNTLLDGTAIKLRLAETLTSAIAKTGQSVSFETTEDVVVDGVTVLPKGSQALATVTDAHSKKSLGRGGKLDVSVDSTRLADGEKVQLRAVRDGKGGGHIGVMTTAIVATTILFFPAAPLFLFIHGKDLTIPKGTEVMAFVQGDTKLDMARFGGPQSTLSAAAAPLPQEASLTVDASVTNCDIEIDGAFRGNTPSTLTVAAGTHSVVVKKSGYADWTRSLVIGVGSVRLSAEMVAK